MIPSIEFDDEFFRKADKIHDIHSYDMLALERHSHAISFQILPQQILGFCWIATILPGMLFKKRIQKRVGCLIIVIHLTRKTRKSCMAIENTAS